MRKNCFSAVLSTVICIMILLTACGTAGTSSSNAFDKIDLENISAKSPIEQLSDHIWLMPQDVETDRPNLYLIVGEKDSVMIDAGASPQQAKEFYSEIQRLNLPAPSKVLLTHWHWDHSFGASAIPADIYAHPITSAYLQVLSTWDWSDAALERRVANGMENAYVEMTMKLELPDRSALEIRVPTNTISDNQSFDLGGVTVQANYLNCDHSDDSVGYYVKEDGILLIGDIMYEDYYHGPDHFSELRLNSIIDRIKEHPASSFHGSHTDGIISREQLVGFFENALATDTWSFGGDSWDTLVMRTAA